MGKQSEPHDHLLPSKLFGKLEGEVETPEDLQCPITMEKMIEPVTASDGHTYDRHAIQNSFNSGNMRSPMTNKDLTCQYLTPNFAMKSRIENWISNNYGTKGLENRIIQLIGNAFSTRSSRTLISVLEELLGLLSRYDVFVPDLERNVKSISREWKDDASAQCKLADLKNLCEIRRKSIHSRHVSFRRSKMKVVHLVHNEAEVEER